ncbi:MAG: RagB/SusD family nutrient uptake outer membrane protein [Parabacteroides gordonii]|nr:RagB/SusD family nutrient uptake outer membrane protein [Parabacteroides gordonii]
MKTNRYKNILACCVLGSFLFTHNSCKEGLDYENENSIVSDAVWKDAAMINGFFNDIHGGLNPGWRFDAGSSDEGISGVLQMSNYLRGMITVDNTNVKLDYAYIEKINFFLKNLAEVDPSVMPEGEKDVLVGQAKFWRAWSYWGMVKQLGGVPLILEPQDATNKEALYVERNKTSECVAQILQDLDDAIAVLPGRYADEANDYGRITKAATLSFKGKVLLFYASPLFNPDNDKSRWEAAYAVNKEAVDFLDKEGYGLYSDFKQLWYDERNAEVIMVNQYFYPGHEMGFYPSPAAGNSDQALLASLLSFPLKDGSYLTVDKERLKNDPEYNQAFLEDFYLNRDDRFYTSFHFGGIPYPSDVMSKYNFTKDMTLWNAAEWNEEEGRFDDLLNKYYGFIGNLYVSGFSQIKGVDQTLNSSNFTQGQTDWIEMRYAEVLMDLGECANELGKTEEALEVLYKIRKRANIEAGADGRYGIQANSVSDIREQYIVERLTEFVYEGKRFEDLRRWKRYDIMNSQGYRQALTLVLKPGETPPTTSETIYDPEVRKKFKVDYLENVDGDPNYKFDLDLNHWFYAMNPEQISQSMGKLEQNKEWGGTFDPLE